MTDIDKKLLFQQNSALCSGVEGQFHCMPAKRNDCGHKFYYSSSEFPVTMPEINEFFCRNSRNSKVMIKRNKGSVLLITIFLVAFLAAIVMGMLQVNTQELRFMMDHIQSLQAVATAEAGLNDALYQIRQDKDWNTGFNNKGFSRVSVTGSAVTDTYSVAVAGAFPSLTVTCDATTINGYQARVEAAISIEEQVTAAPYTIRIDDYRINQ